MTRAVSVLSLAIACAVTACGKSNGHISGVVVDGASDARGGSILPVNTGGAPATLRDARAAKPPVEAAAPPATADASNPANTPDGGRHYSTDRTTFFGAPRCSAAHVQLCEDFESGVLDKSTWETNGAPTIDGVHSARGSHALHVLKVGDGSQYIREKKTFPEKDDTYWGRAFVYFEKLPDVPMNYAHWTFIAASGTVVDGEIRLSGQRQNGNNYFGVGTDNRTMATGTGDWTTSDKDPKGKPNPVQLHTWSCIEWLHAGGKTNETRFFLDGTEHESLHTTETVNGATTGQPYKLPSFTNVWLGWQEYQTSTETFELWMDEIAIDSARIGCDI